MKLICLFLIALLLMPCPVCWAHGFAATGEVEHSETEAPVSAPACCCRCSQSRPAPETHLTQRHEEQHDCPCFCHATEIVFAQTTPAVHLRGVTVPLSDIVDPCCLTAFTATSKNSDANSASVPIAVPLRL